MPAKLTTEKFIEKAKAVHGDAYTYENTRYVHSQKKVLINCPVHKAFEALPAMHLRGRGCPECGLDNVGRPVKTQEEFIRDAKKKHGNTYDYSKVEYVSSDAHVTIRCKIHGDFEQLAGAHVHGSGCAKCANDYVTSLTRDSTESFVRKAQLRHGYEWDYSTVQYKNNSTKIRITCRKHGVFIMTPNHHMNGYGCKTCRKENGTVVRPKK